MRKIEFITDFANKKKGETMDAESMLASDLVRIHKVAKYIDEIEESPKQESEKVVKGKK